MEKKVTLLSLVTAKRAPSSPFFAPLAQPVLAVVCVFASVAFFAKIFQVALLDFYLYDVTFLSVCPSQLSFFLCFLVAFFRLFFFLFFIFPIIFFSYSLFYFFFFLCICVFFAIFPTLPSRVRAPGSSPSTDVL